MKVAALYVQPGGVYYQPGLDCEPWGGERAPWSSNPWVWRVEFRPSPGDGR